MNNVRMVKLGDVLTQRKEKIFVEDPLQAKLISVRLYGKGALQREIGDGKVPKAFTGYIGHTGQLVLSRIWARKGAIALIPHDLEGVVVTNEFPLFDVDETQVIPKYLIQLLTSNNFGPTLERASSGSSGQNRVRENKFLEISISLPPLEEQKRIVSILDKAKSIQEARERQLAALDELAIAIFQETISSTDFTYMTLDQICGAKGRYGANVPSQDYKVDLPRYIRITDILSDGSLSKKPKSPSGTFSDWEKYFVNSGDLLFARSGATVGKTYIHRDNSNNYVYAGYLIKYHPDPSIAIPEFVYRYTQTSEYDSWVKRAQKAVAQPNINAKQYGSDLMIPVPDLKIQYELIKKIDSVESEKALVRAHLKVSQDIFSFLQSNLFTH
ncbi:restriction endonuclease subunit S [Rothia sp. HSID18069]|uniref:restriction endonuclease subunit S n=1 Tax=Rothia sp. HSID18069 TaxID=2419515 RepID=UPI000F881E40|nr:restriction endonuclease subunit S [Rothia sp. HSID18069]RUP73605.1 restriction endonuclease subunit S [Rothia sp. HSID18069]